LTQHSTAQHAQIPAQATTMLQQARHEKLRSVRSDLRKVVRTQYIKHAVCTWTVISKQSDALIIAPVHTVQRARWRQTGDQI